MKETFEFRYHQNKFGQWIVDRKYLFFGFIPVWSIYKTFHRSEFYPTSTTKEEENTVLVFIRNTIACDQKLDSHKNEYRVVNDDYFKKIS